MSVTKESILSRQVPLKQRRLDVIKSWIDRQEVTAEKRALMMLAWNHLQTITDDSYWINTLPKEPADILRSQLERDPETKEWRIKK